MTGVAANRWQAPVDPMTSSSPACDHFTEAISARADGEDPGLDDSVIDAHLETCPTCRAYNDTTVDLRRRTVIHGASPVPDQAHAIVQRTARIDRRSHHWIVRLLLTVVAVQLVVLAVPDFFADGSDAHYVTHLGAFSVAYAGGLLFVVARPARARTMLLVAIVLVAVLAVTRTLDVVRGDVGVLDLAVHALELCSALLLWILAVPSLRNRRPKTSRPSGEPSELRLVATPNDSRE